MSSTPGADLRFRPAARRLPVSDPASGPTWNALLARVATRYLLYVSPGDVRPDPRAPDRLFDAAEATGAGMVYADYAEIRGETLREHPVNDYQTGSIRDGFDFGPADPDLDGRRPPGAPEVRGDPVLPVGRLV